MTRITHFCIAAKFRDTATPEQATGSDAVPFSLVLFGPSLPEGSTTYSGMLRIAADGEPDVEGDEQDAAVWEIVLRDSVFQTRLKELQKLVDGPPIMQAQQAQPEPEESLEPPFWVAALCSLVLLVSGLYISYLAIPLWWPVARTVLEGPPLPVVPVGDL
jgi:hypothetical protein